MYYFLGLPHPRGQRNNARFTLLAWSTVRLNTDGYAQIENLSRIVSIHETSIVTYMKLDVNTNVTLYKPPSIEKSFPSLKPSDIRINSPQKTSITTTTTTKKRA
jgi:hypothetical protein